ncbi:MAG: helix-turn-helix domain-containing protein [Treponema sp.]|jgi:hypothetical protein|nr:helix-turn-helix domain-containing protein [Treponema sp.]
MNIFGLSLDDLSLAPNPPDPSIDILPGLPGVLSPDNTAHVLAVSLQTVERMIEKGDLIPDLDGNIRKSDLVAYIKSHTLADIPLLEAEPPDRVTLHGAPKWSERPK